MLIVVYFTYILTAGVLGSSRYFKVQYHGLHHFMEKKDLKRTFGVDSSAKVPEYEVTTPYESDESGNLVNRLLQEQFRTRRETKTPKFKYFKVQAFGNSLHLKVTEVKPQISFGAMVQTVDDNGSSTYKEIPRGVYYTGHVMSEPGSLVAINGNKGLAGMIRTQDDTFYIRPIPSHLVSSNEFDGHPHVIYRKSTEEDLSSDHHVSDNGNRVMSKMRTNQHRRIMRQVPHKFLEMALVADNFAISAYGENGIKTHMMIIAHIVTQIFHDSSIGSIKITPVIVRLVLKKDGFGYGSSTALVQRIKALENWATKNFPHSDLDPGHPDAIVLITGGRSGGIATLGSTCARTFGAAVANDAGLGSAVIIAHELAHTMGVSHDGPPCTNHQNIMASTIASGPGSMKWSACSKEKIQEFLSDKSNCLDDRPPISAVVHEPKELYGKLPGQVISRDEQCKKIHGQNFFGCPQKRESCGALGCTKDGFSCSFSTASPADGTRCGDRHWCINGECVDDGSPIINGRWTNWSSFSACTRPCGGGVQFKTRTCTNPAPRNGGKNCIGPDKGHWRICNSQPCPVGTKSFRQLQCEEIDPEFEAHFTSEKCLLTCRKKQVAYPQRIKVKDGTRCTGDPTNRDVCIQGRCKLVGCDNGIESGMKRDRCGICEGDSSECKFVQEFWNERCPGFGPDNACTILEVPIGSTSVYVEQETADKNLLGVKNQEGEYLINIPSWSRTIFAAGTKIHYYHEEENDINKIRIPGPTTERLIIVFVPGHPKTGVWFKMYDPTLSSTVGVKHVQWKVTAWGPCSRKCAIGKQRRTVECTRIDDDSYIRKGLCLKKSRKPAAVRSCNTHACQPEWYQSEWSPCLRTCGKGIQRRQIYCRRRIAMFRFQKLSDSSCSGEKPAGPTQRSCNAIICPAEWKPTAWSKCSSTCVGGVKQRNLVCKRRNDMGRTVLAPEIHCHHAPKPQTTIDCNTDVPCPTLAPVEKYRGLGCFKDDRWEHAVPDLVKNFRSSIDWSNMTVTIEKCAEYVENNYPRNKVFALQFYGECWSGSQAEYTYDAYGPSSDCWEKVGKEHTNYVYSFE